MKPIKIYNWLDVPRSYTGIVELPDVAKAWYLNGKWHRVDGPAVEYTDGTKAWYLYNKLHREDGPAIERADGSKAWWLNGERHRVDGPAVELADGTKQWYLNGQHHRVDGPAIEYPNDSKRWKVDFTLPSNSLPFILIEEIDDGRQIKVLTPTGLDIWPNLPGLKQLADNWNPIP